jgi:hypothetical protein
MYVHVHECMYMNVCTCMYSSCVLTFAFQSDGGLGEQFCHVQLEVGRERPVVVGHPQKVAIVEAVVERPGQDAGAAQVRINAARNFGRDLQRQEFFKNIFWPKLLFLNINHTNSSHVWQGTASHLTQQHCYVVPLKFTLWRDSNPGLRLLRWPP